VLLFTLVATSCIALRAQVRVMPRVDVRSPVVRVVVQFWIDSLESWRASTAPITASDRGSDVLPGGMSGIVKDWFAQDEEVRQTFPPTILSVEPSDDAWIIRTMFSHINAVTGDIYPLGILHTRVVKRDTAWVIVDPLTINTRDWKRTTIGLITYVHEGDRTIDEKRASESSDFLTLVAREFDQPIPDSVTFFLVSDRDAMCNLLGVEYYAAPPSALSYPSAAVIISSTNDEWNPHELVHVVLAPYEKAVPVIREGLATLLGGSLGRSFEVLLEEYIANHEAEKMPSLRQLFTHATQEEQYIIGAALCRAVYDKQGRDGLVTLLSASTPLRAMDHIARILGMNGKERDASLKPVLSDVNATLKSSVRSGRR